MFNLKEYADRLAGLYVRRKDLQIGVSHNEQDIEARRLAMIPADDWPGKTVDQRKTNGEKAYADDETLQKMRAMLSKLRDELTMLEGEIEAQEVQFKSARWQIRQDTNEVLRQRRIASEPEDAEGDDPGDVTTAVTDEAAYAQLIGAEDDVFPF